MDDNGSKLLNGLSPGATVLLSVEGYPSRMQSLLVGLGPGKFVLVTLPKQTSTNPEAVFPVLYPGNGVTCYTMAQGIALGFRTQIIRFIMAPFPLMFLVYPTQFEVVSVRKHERVKCIFDGILVAGQAVVHGIITDLSCGGCGFTFGKGNACPEIHVDERVMLESPQLGIGEEQPLIASVRSLNTNDNCNQIGLRFDSMPADTLDKFQRLIGDALRLGQT